MLRFLASHDSFRDRAVLEPHNKKRVQDFFMRRESAKLTMWSVFESYQIWKLQCHILLVVKNGEPFRWKYGVHVGCHNNGRVVKLFSLQYWLAPGLAVTAGVRGKWTSLSHIRSHPNMYTNGTKVFNPPWFCGKISLSQGDLKYQDTLR